MKYSYPTQGTCSIQINLDVEGGVIKSCEFVGGYHGNTQAVARLIAGRRVSEVIPMLKGIQCQNGTSCPDQLARALERAVPHGATGSF